MDWVGNVVDIVDLFSVQNVGLLEQIKPKWTCTYPKQICSCNYTHSLVIFQQSQLCTS